LQICYISNITKQGMSLILKYIFRTCLVIISLFLTACNQTDIKHEQPPEAVKSIIDLRNWDFENNGMIPLAGEWAFFWEELLHPDQITNLNQVPYASVPDIWTSYKLDGITLTPEGYATYYLKMYPPDLKQIYGLYIKGEGSAYYLWVDGQLLAKKSQVGTEPQTVTPSKGPITVFFEPEGEVVEIVVQIANYHHRKGGFRNNFLFGLAESIHQYQMQKWFADAFFFGIFFMMGLYHMFMYTFQTNKKSPFYFALVCWLLALRVGITNQSILLSILPNISWSVIFRVEYLTFFLTPPLFMLFIKSLYPRDIPRWFVRAVFGFGIGFTLFMIFTDTLTLSYAPKYYQLVIILEVIFSLFFIGRIIIKRREGAFYIGLASFIFAASIVIETLAFRYHLPFGKVTPYGFMAFIFVQAILLSFRFSKSFRRVETLSIELEGMNVSLQHSERKY
jgi:hypothetical protein